METLGLTIKATARELQVHEQTVRALVKEGRIRTVRSAVGTSSPVPRSSGSSGGNSDLEEDPAEALP